ncbi:MAG: four helix bundle protein [Bacteroidetes bacterium]|nr:four helix bundle protein [Bacteroidota bacterium]
MKVFEKHEEYGNPILEKSFQFAVRIVKFYLNRIKESYELRDLLRQLMRSGTSIGANVAESQEAASRKDFVNKLSIALKEARETEYWLKVFEKSSVISEKEFASLFNDCDEIIRLLVSILKKLKEN